MYATIAQRSSSESKRRNSGIGDWDSPPCNTELQKNLPPQEMSPNNSPSVEFFVRSNLRFAGTGPLVTI